MVSLLFIVISTYKGFLLPKSSLLKNSSGTIQSISGRMIRGSYLFLRGISPKVDLIVGQEFDLVYYDVGVKHISHNVTGLLSYICIYIYI